MQTKRSVFITRSLSYAILARPEGVSDRHARDVRGARRIVGQDRADSVKGVVMTWIKKAVWLLVAAFVLFYLFTRPEQAAAAVKTFVGAFDAIVRFFTALAAR
jgi:hypothetical protein